MNRGCRRCNEASSENYKKKPKQRSKRAIKGKEESKDNSKK